MVRVQLFGAFAMECGQQQGAMLRANARPLASYVCSFPNVWHHREKILDLFWREVEPERARALLSKASWRIRELLTLQSSLDMRLDSTFNEVRLEIANTSVVDVHRFRAAARVLDLKTATLDVEAIQCAVNLYNAPFLEDRDDDWVLQERETLKSVYLYLLSVLMRTYVNMERAEHAIVCGRRILACDPLRESVHRLVMLLYVVNSQRGAALLQFERCRKALRDECDIEPMPRTHSLVKIMRSEEIWDRVPELIQKELSSWRDLGPPPYPW